MRLRALTISLWSLLGAIAQAGVEEWARDFTTPPDSARPWVYWFWLNSNITSNGVTADLEAMKRVGIGGVLIMEVDQGAPVGPASFMGPGWRDLFKHVVKEAQRLGLEVNMNNDAGWNGSGGPWIRPEQAMQKVVWSETQIVGPRRFEADLPLPPMVAGYYRDIAVQAFRTPGAYRIDNLAVKAGFQVGGVGVPATSNLPPAMVIARDGVLDLTERMAGNGRLVWEVPAGEWTVLRLGHTCTGVENAPAPASGRGLECDKLSPAGLDANYAGMMEKLIGDVGPAAGRTLTATHIDSWENGSQNWTPRMREEFQARAGYDPLPYLPVLSGRVVGSLEISERFLWDWRRTISQLVIDNYAARLGQHARGHGMRLSIEAYGGPCDNLAYAGRADEPMCEFWIGGGAMETCKEMASAAHTYGKPILGAEAFTAADQERWLEHPGSIKALGDRAFCDGVNRFVFHRYALQPWRDYAPGMTMGPWGLHYERTQTWWEESGAWHRYLARAQALLRQGQFVADVCYLQSQASPGTRSRPRLGYDYDECSPEVVLTRMSVREGRLTLVGGMSYQLLVLPEDRVMTPDLLAKLRVLVEAGATVLGPRPSRSPSLRGYPQCDAEVRRLADDLWGQDESQASGEHRCGQGRVVWGTSPERVLARMDVKPDFRPAGRLGYIHRSGPDAECYFVANPRPESLETLATFRVTGLRPQLWWPDTGRREWAAAWEDKDGVTSVPLRLEPAGSVFVVFVKSEGNNDAVTALSRNGQSLLPTRGRESRAQVRKAVYGVAGDESRSRDVREAVQGLLDQGEESLAVSELALGSDPAPGERKTLTVDYELEGRTNTVTARDGERAHFPEYAPAVRIGKAIYGVPGDAVRTRDVTEKLRRLVRAGEYRFQVARMAEGDDPAYLVVKTLTVDYTVDGAAHRVQGTDPELLTLAQRPLQLRPAIAEPRQNLDGGLDVESWQEGDYELETRAGRKQRWQVTELPRPQELPGPWEIRFAPPQGGPEAVTVPQLQCWTQFAEPRLKYFSGTATYRRKVSISPTRLGDRRRLYLDLGAVEVMARVRLNGNDLGLLWKAPYVVDITAAARAGENDLEIQVVNLWVNRLIGDEQLPEDSQRNADGTLKEWPDWVQQGRPSPSGRFTFTSWRLWKKDAPLRPSGLLGPVRLVSAERQPVVSRAGE